MNERLFTKLLLWIALTAVSCASSGCVGTADSAPSADSSGRATLTVAAASDLIPAFEELGELFTQESGIEVVFNFGSTGQLAQQIERGAPIDLFAAANRSFVEDLDRAGLLVSDSITSYAQGRITLWTRADSPLRLAGLDDLEQESVKRVAIANPEHAPYGIAAREALQTAGLWEALQPKLILGENVAQALQYAETGNVDVAIVALSLSIAAGDAGRYVLLPTELYQPLNQTLAVVRSSQRQAEARRFIAFVKDEAGRSIMRRYGFTLPDEDPLP
ncbi:MAG: molybdate ABC transporter substrate-binding protein [Anaerolineae bacterium]|nr:molybdate ABC transporter substrate-binding protein [Anaerolineae bacterium]MDW8173384.1 molybdate ABC transporter substrate-binding protein [Anaerolineae bacterium]